MNRVTLGGNRLGAGNQMKVNLSQYPRSTFNMSRQWRSTMAAGLLVPCFKDIVLPGDTWDIKMQAKIFTIPTIGPVFGSCKFQVDFFFAPFRLYNGALHNNAIGIGLKMDTIKFPLLGLGITKGQNIIQYKNPLETEINQSSLNAYLGVRDTPYGASQTAGFTAFGALHLMYYDIFKNSYANKQENNAYVMGVEQQEPQVYMEFIKLFTGDIVRPRLIGDTPQQMAYGMVAYNAVTGGTPAQKLVFEGEDLDPRGITLQVVTKSGNEDTSNWTNERKVTLSDIIVTGSEQYNSDKSQLIVQIDPNNKELTANSSNTQRMLWWRSIGQQVIEDTVIPRLVAFPLVNIDNARRKILSYNDGTAVRIQDTTAADNINYLPYVANVKRNNKQFGNVTIQTLWAKQPLVGLLAKTYQADVFNAWLNSEFVDQITANTAVTISNGRLEMNSLLMAEKMFNLQTDITIAGGTYKDWRKAMWGVESTGGIETPIYLGGYSSEIIFDEVVANANSQNSDGQNVPTGSLAGKGSLFADAAKGGRVRFKAKEEGMLMGIVSITPRIDYSQGNAWFARGLQNMQNLHTPALDRIGFQDLLMNTQIGGAGFVTQNGVGSVDPATGKVPAWIFYQTAFNEVYGEFATGQSQNFMVFTRDYEPQVSGNMFSIVDNTTYINPKKTNKVFADASETGQNFWVQLGFKVNTRRKMSSNPIPRF